MKQGCDEGLCPCPQADRPEKGWDQKEPQAPVCGDYVVFRDLLCTALGQLGHPLRRLGAPCILPLLFFLFLLPYPSPLYGLSDPHIPSTNSLSPADTITSLPAALAIISPCKIRSLEVWGWGRGGK